MNLNINGAEIKGQNSVTLFVVEIDNEYHISNICKNAGNKKMIFLEFRVFQFKKRRKLQ